MQTFLLIGFTNTASKPLCTVRAANIQDAAKKLGGSASPSRNASASYIPDVPSAAFNPGSETFGKIAELVVSALGDNATPTDVEKIRTHMGAMLNGVFSQMTIGLIPSVD
jgi:hypothetical protein